MKGSKKFFNKKGQGIVEYILITALVTIVTIAVFRQFRTDLNEAYRRVGSSLVNGVSESLEPTTPASE